MALMYPQMEIDTQKTSRGKSNQPEWCCVTWITVSFCVFGINWYLNIHIPVIVAPNSFNSITVEKRDPENPQTHKGMKVFRPTNSQNQATTISVQKRKSKFTRDLAELQGRGALPPLGLSFHYYHHVSLDSEKFRFFSHFFLFTCLDLIPFMIHIYIQLMGVVCDRFFTSFFGSCD